MSSFTEKPRLFSIPKLSVDKKLSVDRKSSFSPRVTTDIQPFASSKDLTRPDAALKEFSFKSEHRLVDTNGNYKSLEINKASVAKRRGSAPDTSLEEFSESKSKSVKKKKPRGNSGNSYSLKSSYDSYSQRFSDLKTPQGSTVNRLTDYYPIYSTKPLPPIPNGDGSNTPSSSPPISPSVTFPSSPKFVRDRPNSVLLPREMANSVKRRSFPALMTDDQYNVREKSEQITALINQLVNKDKEKDSLAQKTIAQVNDSFGDLASLSKDELIEIILNQKKESVNNQQNYQNQIQSLNQQIATLKAVHETSLERINILNSVVNKYKVELKKSSVSLQVLHRQITKEREKYDIVCPSCKTLLLNSITQSPSQ